MAGLKIKGTFLFIFILAGAAGFSLKAEACTASRSCPPKCVSHRYETASDTSCYYGKGCCTWTCGEYGNECCGDYSCACGSPCTPPPCSYSQTGTDSDSDGYDKECDDCNDSNSRVNPGSSNPYCDCNSSTPSAHPSTSGISELTGCHLDSSGRHFGPGCLCLDGKDNDCDGKIDLADPDCPDPTNDLVIDTNVSWGVSKNTGKKLYITSGSTLTIESGVTLEVKEVHLADKTARIVLQKDAQILLSH